MTKLGRAEGYIVRKGMAAMPKDWKRIEDNQDIAHQEVVDHSHHLTSHPAPEHYAQFLNSPELLKSQKDPMKGKSTKMIHQIPTDEQDPSGTQEPVKQTIMTKPYHQNLYSGTRSWVKHPIQGWATMTSKSVYDAAGLNNNIEQVATHEHNGIPVTVHSFSPNYKTIYSLQEEQGVYNTDPVKRSVNPLQVEQIAAMDFLMGNNDRHPKNLMVADHTDDQGYHNLLSIDHERNFQYFKPLNAVRKPRYGEEVKEHDHPADYISNSALREAKRAAWNNDHWDFYEWWKTAGPKIKEDFERNLEYIKDTSIRDHIRKNFERRYDMLQKWASDNEEHNYETNGFFSKEYPHIVRMIPKPRATPETIRNIRSRLPKNDPVKAIKILAEASGQKRTVAAQQKIYDVFKSILHETNSETLPDLYDKFKNDPTKIFGQNIWFHILKHIDSLTDKRAAKLILKYDAGKGKIPLFWKERFGGGQ